MEGSNKAQNGQLVFNESDDEVRNLSPLKYQKALFLYLFE
jgi:hypothetical protein